MVLADLVLLLVFLTVLAKSAQIVISSSIKLSSFFGISQVAVGFLLISTATSLPELAVSFISSSVGEGALSLGNVFGSNIADILLILGLAALIYGFKIKKEDFVTIAPVLLVSSIVAFALLFFSVVNRLHGVVLLIAFASYAYYLIKKRVAFEASDRVTKEEAVRSFAFFFISIVVVLFTSAFIVDSSVRLASGLGVANGFIGATLIAVGTSLPELAVDIQAIRRKKYGLAIGDAIGSVMTNSTLVLGSAAVIRDIVFDVNIAQIYLIFNIVACVALFIILKMSDKIRARKGAVLLVLYFIYLLFLINTQINVMK